MKILAAADFGAVILLPLFSLAAQPAQARPGPIPQTERLSQGGGERATELTARLVDSRPRRALRRAPAASELIRSGGGTIGIPGVVRVVFPAGAFPAPQQARVEQTTSIATAQAFADTAAIFQPGATLGYEIRITTGPAAPQAPVEVSVAIPPEVSIPAGSRMEAFAQFWQQDEEDAFDSFELVPSTFVEAARTVTVTLPPAAFTSLRRHDGAFEAIVILAPTPGDGVTAVRVRSLAAATILPPLEAVQVRSAFNPTRQVTVGGVVYTGHWGTDFVATDGTPIFATGDATILRAYDSGAKSFGNSVLLQMQGAGVVRYAHLQSYDVDAGDKILAGQEIGFTDNTGLSTGAHLHFELAPDGKFASNKSKVDPAPLIQNRPLTWHLTALAVYESKSAIPGLVNESALRLLAEANLRMRSDGLGAMALTLTDGTLRVQSYTGMYDKGSNTICTYSFSPRSYPLRMHDGVSLPAEGDTLGGMGFQRDRSQSPSTRYSYAAYFYTDERPEFTEHCPGTDPVNHPILLSGSPWINVGGGPFYLDPEADTTTDTLVVDSSIPGYLTHTSTYDWTLDKTY